MSKSYNTTTRGVVISRKTAHEGSIRADLYTEHFGLVSAFAKSAREERSKLRAHLQMGCFGSYTLVRSPRDSRVTGAFDTKNIYFELGHLPCAQVASARIVAIVRQLVHGEDENGELFDALWNMFSTLPRLANSDVRIVEALGAVRILKALGYVPITASIPHLNGFDYATATISAVAPHEKKLTELINAALAASHLKE